MARRSVGYIDVEILVKREGNQYSSWCPTLDISSCGDTPQEAIENCGEALELYLAVLEEDGEREEVFQQKNIRILSVSESSVPTLFVTQYRQKVTISV